MITAVQAGQFSTLVKAIEAAGSTQGEAIKDALKTLSGSFPAPYTALVADRRGDVLLLQGQREQAAAEFGKAYQGLTAESGDYRRLVGMKLNALGIDPDAGAKAGAAS